ncbi:MAG: hypothetical protein ACOXZZ_05275 [Sphaerochaetaceae bacterium]
MLNDVYAFIKAYEKNNSAEFNDYVKDDGNDIEFKLFEDVFGENEPNTNPALRIRKTLETLIDASDLSGFDLFDVE